MFDLDPDEAFVDFVLGVVEFAIAVYISLWLWECFTAFFSS